MKSRSFDPPSPVENFTVITSLISNVVKVISKVKQSQPIVDIQYCHKKRPIKKLSSFLFLFFHLYEIFKFRVLE